MVLASQFRGTKVPIRIFDGVDQAWAGKHTRFADDAESNFRIVDDTEQVWAGKHTRFADDVVERDVRKWHCGNGNGGGNPLPESKLSAAAAIRKIYDEVIQMKRCQIGFCGIHPLEEQGRFKNQLKPFIDNAQKGDIIYLHTSTLSQKGGALSSAVTHWGRYTGEPCTKLSHLCGFPSPPDRQTLSINVVEWFPVETRFGGAGKQLTLYEVTDRPEYKK